MDLPPPPTEELPGTVDLAEPPSPRGGGRAARFDRVPPHSLEAEVAVLGASMQNPAALPEVLQLLTADDFYRTAHRTVFDAIHDLSSTGNPVDQVTILEWLRARGRLDEIGGPVALVDLTEAMPTAANAIYYAGIVREKALLRRLIEAGTEVVRMGYEEAEDVKATVDRAESIVFGVADAGTKNDVRLVNDLLRETFEQIEELAERQSEVTGLATGFDDLDRLTAGLQPQNLVIIAARPAMGKSSLTLNMAHYVTTKLHEPVLCFNLEMSANEIVQRLLSQEAGIPSNRLRTGQLDEHDWGKLSDALGVLSQAPLYIDDTPSISVMDIRAKARRLKQTRGLSLVIVDYLQLMQGRGKVDSRQQEVAEISRGLKMLAKELDVPVIALSQLSRQPEARTDKRPMLADLRESGCLTRDTRLFRADTGAAVTFGELLDGDLRDVPVWAADAAGRLVAGNLTHAFPSGRKEVFEVRLRSGAIVQATANHPFRTLEGWSPLGELEVGARVATARRLPEGGDPVPMDDDELVLLAHLIGEGTIVARQPIHYTSADAANLEAVEKAAFGRFGITARHDRDGRSAVTTQLYLPSPHHLTHGRRNPIAAWLDELGLWDLRSWEKHLPSGVFALPDDQLRLFLRHLFATDGCLHVRAEGQRGPRVSLYYATSSPRLAQDVRLALLRLGIRARVRRVEHPGRAVRDGYQVWVYGADQQRDFLRTIGFHGERGDRIPVALAALEGVSSNTNVDTVPRETWARVRDRRVERGLTERQFQAELGSAYCGSGLYKSAMSRQRLERVAEVLDDEDLRALATSDLFWDEIVEVRSLGEQEVFDATVDEHHNFVAEGLVLHNSIEQDADIVGFIYRDEVYHEDSEDMGVAELIIAKHRNGSTRTIKLAFLSHLTKFANLARGGL